jgi:DNA-directed RNA polymerase subunit RPC12/RpoP
MRCAPNQEADPRNINDNKHPYFFRESGYGKSLDNLRVNKFKCALCSKVNSQQDVQLGMRCQTKLIEIQPMNRIKAETDSNTTPIDDQQCVLNVENLKKAKKVQEISLIKSSQKSEEIARAKLFSSAAASVAHKLSHKCKVCSMKFENESMLKKHLQSHGKERYMCMLCSKTFTFNCNLVRH